MEYNSADGKIIMRISLLFSSNKVVQAVLVMLALLLFFGGGYYAASVETDELIRTFQLLLLGVLTLLILRHPHWGIALIVASLPVLDLLPSIPIASSVVSLLGVVTLGAYLVPHLLHRRRGTVWSAPLIWGGLFVLWIIVSNPSAALLPGNNDRNWAFTFVQLWLFAWLTAQLFDSASKYRDLMWMFSLAVLVSALYALTQGNIGESLRESERAAGLVGGANTAARYFVVGMILLYYLRTTAKKTFLRLILLPGLGVLIFATFFTVSRTGLLLLFAAIGLFFVQQLDGRRQVQALIVLSLVFIIIWLFADNILLIMGTIFTSVREGSDTVGLRYNLWTGGWRMWLDFPIQGVGIGQYVERLAAYGSDLLSLRHLRLGAHNMYVQVLAETGLVGIFLFVSMLFASARGLWRLSRSENVSISALAQTWLVVLIIMLLGGLTKHDHYDKLIWITLGLSAGRFGRLVGPHEKQ